jgi:hypothetical protein
VGANAHGARAGEAPKMDRHTLEALLLRAAVVFDSCEGLSALAFRGSKSKTCRLSFYTIFFMHLPVLSSHFMPLVF